MSYLVYVTVPQKDAALRLARLLVERRLAAGANVLPGAFSVYRWQGKVREAEECLLLAQVSRAAFADVMALVRQEHPYQLPCVVALPLEDGLRPFLRWIDRNSRPLA
ncbi:divalent-cation tolerance protein CutA [Desulfovibrio legallii]|uniref:Divalent cation tolerance protein n=1 Tax=Desulfovibrio legallii TaxID=571438 RepID=A0A1G7L1E9_9BACT|nr:divalent-cation tolerance protein CutA [Desulfovibrio legallii]SDF43337.1 divalent cation tolerance protein [Desulfovibrio legallii]